MGERPASRNGSQRGTPGLRDEILARCLDRLNAGESVDLEDLRRKHPEIAEDLIQDLEVFQQVGVTTDSGAPLGTLGDYTLRRQIGRGGMGVVYEAWENSMDRRVALKVLPAGIAADERAVARFIREAQLAGRLNDPNVVSVYGMGVKEQTPYYTMEYVEGETLAQVLAKMKVAEPDTHTPFGKKDQVGYFAALANSFANVADGLQHAHSHKVIHRDIKPSNLILDQEGRLRILDFGLARLEGQESLTLSGDFLGTPQYMSPEQARRQKIPVDHRTDVYSLGATMQEVLTGRPPFEGKDHQETLSWIIECDPTPASRLNFRVPRDLETIVMKCLRKEASDRYGSAEALAQDLRRFARGDPVEARPGTEWERWGRRCRQNRGKIAAFCVMAFLVVAATFFAARDLRARRLRREGEYEPRVMEAVMQVSARPLSKQWSEGHTYGVLPHGLEEAIGEGASNYIAEAVRALQAAASLHPGKPDADYHRARWLLLLEDPANAELALRSALERAPDFAPGRALLARVLERRGALDESRAELDRASRTGQAAWTEAWMAADRAVDEFGWQVAEEAFGKLITLELDGQPPYAGSMMESLVGRGRARLELHRHTEAIEDFARAEHLWPRWPIPTLFKAKAYARRGDIEKADAILMGLWQRFENKDEIAFQASQLFKHLGALNLASRWAEHLSTPYLQACLRAHLSFFSGRLHEGLAWAREAIRLHPQDIFARNTIALIAYNDPRWSGPRLAYAEQCCREAVALAPRRSYCHEFLALVLHTQGRTEAALSVCDDGIRAEPNAPWCHEARGIVLMSTGAVDEAISEFERAVELGPLQPFPRKDLARALLRASRYEEAIDAARKALRVAPGYDDFWWVLGRCLEKSGRFEEAMEAYRQAARLVLPGHDFDSTFMARGDLARLLAEKDRIGEALVEARAVLERHPPQREVNALIRRLLQDEKLGGHEEELRAIVALLEKAAAGGKEDPEVLKTLAEAWHRGRPGRDDAKALQFAALAAGRSGPADLEAPLILAAVQHGSGLTMEAVRTLEETLERKGSSELLLERLSAYRKDLLPDFASYPSIDAEVDGLERARAAFTELAPLTRSEGIAPRLLYLEGRLLQLEGQHAEALERFQRLLAEDPERPEPFLQAVASHRALGDFTQAEELVRGRMAAGTAGDRMLLRDLWARIALLDQRRDPAELLFSAPDEDLRWLMETLASGGPIRIDCGDMDIPPGDPNGWSRDRFFSGGRRYREWKDEEGTTFFTPFEGEIRETPDPAPYRMTRSFDPWGPGRPGYRIPLPPGRYRLHLHFAETWYRAPGLRIFDVIIDGRRVLESYEPFRAGFATARVESIDVQVDDALLEIELVRKSENPFLSALEVERRE